MATASPELPAGIEIEMDGTLLAKLTRLAQARGVTLDRMIEEILVAELQATPCAEPAPT